MKIPEFDNRKDRIKFVVENKDKLLAAKQADMKRADGIAVSTYTQPVVASKAMLGRGDDQDILKVSVIINTTNWFDSHGDVHLDGIWNKSLKENKFLMFLQEHDIYSFKKIIADGEDLKAYTKKFKFRDLGFDADGVTEALVFDAVIRSKRNEFMFEQYKNGYVRNHSVGMRYVKVSLAVDDDDEPAYKTVWDKYYPLIGNKEAAKEAGYFFAVHEAKIIEGSAVPLGSNTLTPTLEPAMTTPEEKTEPSPDTLQKALRETIKSVFNN